MDTIKSDFINVRPISINQVYQGRRYRTNAFKKWQELVYYHLPAKKTIKGSIGIVIYLYLKSIWRSDIDNFIKPIVDCLVARGYIKDDRYITHLEVQKFKNKKEGFKFEIIKL